MLNNFESTILVEKTIQEEGYDPNGLGNGSRKYIWVICRVCGEPIRVRMISYRASKNSAIHKENCYKIERSSIEISKETVLKRKRTCLARYGVDVPLKSSKIMDKVKQTNLEKYGVENISQCNIIKDKRKQTNIDRHGVDNVSKSSKVKEKRDKTFSERFGGHPFSNSVIREKIKGTLLSKYGIDNISKSDEIKEKKCKKARGRYGVDSVLSASEVRGKIVKTNNERYGGDSPANSELIRGKMVSTFNKRYGVDNPLQNNEIKEKVKKTNIEKYGVDNPSKDEGVKRKRLVTLSKNVSSNVGDKYHNINVLRCNEEFWEDHKKLTLSELSEKYSINYNYLTVYLNSAEFIERHRANYSYQKFQQQKDLYNKISEFYKGQIDFNTRSIISPYEIDIYIPEFKVGIEYCGSFWHSELCKGVRARNLHINKYNLCKGKGIRLITIFDNWYINKLDKVLSIIKCSLGVYDTVVFARKCQVDNNECQEFIQEHHFQGSGGKHIKYFNLVYNGEIISSMTGGRHHRQNVSGNPIVLDRFCVKSGYKVIGGSHRLFRRFVEWAKCEGYDRVISWSDNCWASGGLYERLGFNLCSEYGSDYFYWDHSSGKYYSKHSQMKNVTNCPSDLTESEWCNMNGLWRLWDCGKKKWEYKL